MWHAFWQWYNRNYRLNVSIATALFALQIVHLYWLTNNVIIQRLVGQSFFPDSQLLEYIIIAVDYTEIPALISASMLYFHELRQGTRARSLFFLVLINSQWLHLFWITDEFVIREFVSVKPDNILPIWLAWVAISIDYLELPVIVDTVAKLVRSYKKEVLVKD